MTIRELTDHIHQMCHDHGWYNPDSPWPQTPRNIAISVAVEAAEVLEHFQWGEDYDRSELAGELADVAMYLFQLADLVGVDLAQAIQDKIRVNAGRTWAPPIMEVHHGDTEARRGTETVNAKTQRRKGAKGDG